MKKLSADDPRIAWLSFNKFDQFLRRNQWQGVAIQHRAAIMYSRKYDGFTEAITLLLPQDFDVQDAPLRLTEAINQLSVLEQRAPYEIIREIEFELEQLSLDLAKESQLDRVTKWQPLGYALTLAIILFALTLSISKANTLNGLVILLMLISLMLTVFFALENSLSPWSRSLAKYFSYLRKKRAADFQLVRAGRSFNGDK